MNSGTTDEPRAQQSGELQGEAIPRDAVKQPRHCSTHHVGRPSTSCFRGDKNCDTADILNLKKISSRLYTNVCLMMSFFCSTLKSLRPVDKWIWLAQRKLCGCEFEWKCKHGGFLVLGGWGWFLGFFLTCNVEGMEGTGRKSFTHTCCVSRGSWDFYYSSMLIANITFFPMFTLKWFSRIQKG